MKSVFEFKEFPESFSEFKKNLAKQNKQKNSS